MLETERLILRRWKDSDREPFAEMNADPRVMEFFPDTLTREESDQLIENIESHFDNRGFGLFATELKAEGKLIGLSDCTSHRFRHTSRPVSRSAGALPCRTGERVLRRRGLAK